MLSQIRPAIVLLALFTLLTGLAYPLAITGIAQVAFYHQANGSLVPPEGAPVGSALIGQNFASDKYFHGRPSATQAQDPAHPDDSTKTIDAPYNAANSTGSNLGPTSQKLLDRVKADVAAKRAAGWAGDIPADSVTTSASGLDPHISPDNALAQVAVVAKARECRGPRDRSCRRAARQRAAAEHGARRAEGLTPRGSEVRASLLPTRAARSW